MKDFFVRTNQLANYIIETKATIRQTAKVFNMAKSTVHYDLQNRLPIINNALYSKVQEILNKNFEEKNIRGGMATKNKYLKLKSNTKQNWILLIEY